MTPEIFRQRYPQGGLISELAAIEHGQFIVRVLVEIDGVAIASGLAAAPSVEQAEDQARIRALNLLGSATHGVIPSQKQLAADPVPTPATVVTKPQISAPTPVVQQANLLEQPPLSNPVGSNFKFDLPLSEPPEEEPVIEELSPVGMVTEAEETLDFSDIIARSDVELKRLAWTSDQGRNYLLETYGKRSRQLLSDDELLEFLHYLEQQPSP